MARKNGLNPLQQWLSLTWERTERSYNPDLKEFMRGILSYPPAKVVVDDRGPIGYPDLKLINPNNFVWVVGELKKEDAFLTDASAREALWKDKRKYIDGLTRFMIFVTATRLWVVQPDGSAIAGFEEPLDLRSLDFADLQGRLAFLAYEQAEHNAQWRAFTGGTFPYSYLELGDAEVTQRLHSDLQNSFAELTESSTRVMEQFARDFESYEARRADITRNLVVNETKNRALMRLELECEFVRRLFQESIPQFEDQYGREVDTNEQKAREARVREAFIADSVAALMARVLFLRLVEDLNLMKKRRLSNGGPANWAAFVEELTGDARALVRVSCADVALRFPEPFQHSVFDWISHANGELDEALQRFILRLNAYNFAGLSEEILGEIYQQFLPRQKRKRLGEFYTPPSIVDWILEHTVREHGPGTLLDPSCGSGSFLVRHTHARLEDARQRNLDEALVRSEVQDEVWGFDLNPFASFISLFQIIWALLRFAPEGGSPPVHVYNLNSLLRDTDIVRFLGAEHLPPGSMQRDNQQWRYVVGNPPYIRAERVKYSGEMQGLWSAVWGQNADTGLIFLYRSLTEWLESGGFFGMVVSGGYANSEAAAKVWRLLQPGTGIGALRKVVWLEFAEENGRQKSLWDAARVPLILIIERTTPQPDDTIELLVPSQWPSSEVPTKVRYADFFDERISPRITNNHAPWGDYLLPLLRSGDVPLLRKLYPDNKKFQKLGSVVEWTYGIQRGGVAVTEELIGTRPIQVVAGRSLAVAWPGISAGWVDLEAVINRPNGKPSLWRNAEAQNENTLFVSEIGLSPFASVSNDQAALNSVSVGRTVSESETTTKAIAAYLNSKLARFYWALRLRSGVIQGYYAHIYPRTLDDFPWPIKLSPENEARLAQSYDDLAALAARAKDNPNEWLLSEGEARTKAAPLKITDASLGLAFGEGAVEVTLGELQLNDNCINEGLSLFATFANNDIAEYVFRLLTLAGDEDTPIKRADVQKLAVPQDYADLMRDYRVLMASFGNVESDFQQALDQLDSAVYDLFGLTSKERASIETRLTTFPLNRLKPRYPWETVRPRPIKAYMEDRFA